MARGTCPVIATSGVLSMCAVAIPVTRFVAPGPEVATHTPGTAAGARVAVGRVGRGLLVAHQHVAELGILGQRVVERHDRAAGIPEEHVHAFLQQGPAEDLRAGELLSHYTPHR